LLNNHHFYFGWYCLYYFESKALNCERLHLEEEGSGSNGSSGTREAEARSAVGKSNGAGVGALGLRRLGLGVVTGVGTVVRSRNRGRSSSSSVVRSSSSTVGDGDGDQHSGGGDGGGLVASIILARGDGNLDSLVGGDNTDLGNGGVSSGGDGGNGNVTGGGDKAGRSGGENSGELHCRCVFLCDKESGLMERRMCKGRAIYLYGRRVCFFDYTAFAAQGSETTCKWVEKLKSQYLIGFGHLSESGTIITPCCLSAACLPLVGLT
jgi:hypothetical protein